MTTRHKWVAAGTIFGLALAAPYALAQKKYDTGANDKEIKIGNIMPAATHLCLVVIAVSLKKGQSLNYCCAETFLRCLNFAHAILIAPATPTGIRYMKAIKNTP